MKTDYFSQQGKRTNNEDYRGSNECVFTVCDGMGGHAAGEVASRFVVENVLKMFSEKGDDLNKDVINKRLTTIQVQFNGLLEQSPEKEGMGTTFTGVFVGENFWYVAHIGDSRVYFARPSEKKIWHTWDHSMVGDLMRMNEITRERGRNHPMANRISRAIVANSNGKTSSADVTKIDNLRKGDIFLLCSDGVGDAWRDDEICELLCDETVAFEEKLSKIKEKCAAESNDNNTACIIEIEEKDEIDNGENQELTWIPLKDLQENYQQYLREEAEDEESVQVVEDNTDEKDKIEKPVEDQTPENPAGQQAADKETDQQPAADGNSGQTGAKQETGEAKAFDCKAWLSKNRWKIVIGAVIVIVIMLFFTVGNGREKVKCTYGRIRTELKWKDKGKSAGNTGEQQGGGAKTATGSVERQQSNQP